MEIPETKVGQNCFSELADSFSGPVSSLGPPSVSKCVILAYSYKDTIHIELGHTLMISFYPDHLFKAPNSNYGHIWVLEFQHMNLGDTAQPMQVRALEGPSRPEREFVSSKLM